MTALCVAWEYLTGYAVATDPGDRDRAEWPPHPARVFMALAAAWFETGEDPAEGEALRWLEALDDPEMYLPSSDHVFERSGVTVYVPVNDKAGPSAAVLQSAPSITRSKQPRGFPCVRVGHGPCCLIWRTADGVDTHREALDRLCAKVTRIGHSSSLVRMWVAGEGEFRPDTAVERWLADDALAEVRLRKLSRGMLDMLAERFGASARRRHAELTGRIARLEAEKKKVKGKGSRERKEEITAEIASIGEEAAAIHPRPPLRPTIGLWSGYRRAEQPQRERIKHSHFDTDLLVLVHEDGPRLPLVSTQAVTRALRGAVMKHAGVQPAPAWVSGHAPNGDPLADEDGHLAFLPLPFAGSRHADGHLLGVALAFPRSVDRRDRGRVLGPLLVDPAGRAKPVLLALGRLGMWTLRKRDWTETRRGLAPETWTAHTDLAVGAHTWGSVTPVVLDRFPKSDRRKERAAWTMEVAETVAAACLRIGIPAPVTVDVDTTSWHPGCPRAIAKRRRLRNRGHASEGAGAALGDGFPAFPARGTRAPRPQVHVWLRFEEPVVGPVLLGAGRYLGYGLCKPLRGERP